jgi:hypothetical protein
VFYFVGHGEYKVLVKYLLNTSMLYLILHPLKRPAEKQADLLRATLDLYGVDYVECDVDAVPDGATIITDCFLMETPCGDPGDAIASRILDHAAGQNNNIIFYYPSESYATLSASFCPTAEALQAKGINGYLIKCGDWDIDGYVKNYNMPEFFAWIINNEFNRVRLEYTCTKIDTTEKTHKFLFLNGEYRTNRERFFNEFKATGLLDSSIWSHRSGKSAEGFGPEQDWQDPFVHPDFRFYAYYPSHYYQTTISIVSETTQNEWFPTEKTYKSLMLGHPFVVYGGQHSLAKIQNLGFETFAQEIDESYDDCPYPQERADRLVKSLIESGNPQPSRHNRIHFQKVANSAYNNLINILQDIDKRVIIKENFAVSNTILNKYFLN